MSASDDVLLAMQQMLQAMQRNQEDLMQRLQAAGARAAAAEARITGSDRKPGVDMKLLDRINNFDGKKNSWDDWSFSFRATMNLDCEAALAWAIAQEDPIDSLTVEAQNPTNAEAKDWIPFNGQLYTALSLKANAGEAATKIRAAGPGQGLEAWRLIVFHYESRTRGRQRQCFLDEAAEQAQYG